MKEATGEATNTVVTIILIAAVLAAGTIIIKTIMTKIQSRANEVGDETVDVTPA